MRCIRLCSVDVSIGPSHFRWLVGKLARNSCSSSLVPGLSDQDPRRSKIPSKLAKKPAEIHYSIR
jgi:hypothetical protein